MSTSVKQQALAVLRSFVRRSPEDSAERCEHCRQIGSLDVPESHLPDCTWRRAWDVLQRASLQRSWRTVRRWKEKRRLEHRIPRGGGHYGA